MRLPFFNIGQLRTARKCPGASVIFTLLLSFTVLCSHSASAQGEARASARLDATRITAGDEARLFINIQNNEGTGKIQWAAIPDSFNTLEIKERGKIDTLKQGQMITYRQRLTITGFDSGSFKIPSFTFTVTPTSGTPYTIQTDSFNLLVESVAVDTSKAFRPIKGILSVQTSWRDYIVYIIGGLVLIALVVGITIWVLKKKKPAQPKPEAPKESLHDRTLRLLHELEQRQLWQKDQVKQYYVELTDILRQYIEDRFSTPAMELTTDELLYKVKIHKELMQYYGILQNVLYTADLAKFAKAQPLPQEHVDTLEKSKQFVMATKPVVVQPGPQEPAKASPAPKPNDNNSTTTEQ